VPFENDPNAPPRPWGGPVPEPPRSQPAGRNKVRWLSVAFLVLTLTLVGGRAFRDLSRPQAWAYWKDLYFTPTLSASIVRSVDIPGVGHHAALAVTGKIGPAAAVWFRSQLDQAGLAAGDVVVFSSPGGDVGQAVIIGEVIHARGLATAVGVVDAAGRLRPSYCASACVLAYAGGNVRLGVTGSLLGVHRFTTEASGRDLVADTQRTAGFILGYLTRMGVSSALLEAMSATAEIRWLDARQAIDMRLVTDPLDRS
jgi:hypothetical protein